MPFKPLDLSVSLLSILILVIYETNSPFPVVLTSEYPSGSFANIDRTLLPPNTLILGRGWSLQNQISLPGYVLEKFPLTMNVTEKTWHTIRTESPGDETYTAT